MAKLRTTAAVLSVMAGLAASAAGQDGLIKIKINGVVQTWDVGANPNIDLALPGGTSDVHIYDDAGDVNLYDSIGLLTLRGTSTELVRVWIADASVDGFTAFQVAQNEQPAGCRDILGLRFLPPEGSTDNSLLQHAVVSVNVLGDIGEAGITAGQVFRVDAKQAQSPNSYGGTIWGDITAVRGDNQLVAPADAIAYVRARRAIRGAIVATGERDSNDQPLFTQFDRNTWGSITRVVVGGPVANNGGIPTAEGFFGSIDCSYGILEELWTTGQVGEQGAPVSITAGVRVGRVSVRPENSVALSGVLEQPIFAVIAASARQIPVPTDTAGARTSVSLIETEGDFVGSLSLHDFSGYQDTEGPRRAAGNSGDWRTSRKGIFVGGHCNANIDVRYNWEYGDMIARSFADITIGQMLKGAIAAVGSVGEEVGRIGTVSIGRGSLTGAPDRYGLGITNKPGFNGIAYYPMQDVFAPHINGSEAQRRLWYTEPARDYHTLDSVIFASDSIGKVTIMAMSNQLTVTGGKTAKPRVESPLIGELVIGAFDSGAVWSGRLELEGQGETGSNFSNNYSSVGSVHIGCMGPMADLWVEGTAELTVDGDVYGEIRLPRLDDYQTVRIGGRLGNAVQASVQVSGTGCLYLGVPSPVPFDGELHFQTDGINLPSEDSPRGTWPIHGSAVEPSGDPTYLGVAQWSRIVLEDAASLNGEIIIDATNSSNAHRPDAWTGDVVIGTGVPGAALPAVVLSTNSERAVAPFGFVNSAAVAPRYAIPSVVLGTENLPSRGGSVGLVPFAVYGADSRPTDPMGAAQPVIGASDFAAGLASVDVAFYGPVRLDEAVLGPTVCLISGVTGECGVLSSSIFTSSTTGRVLNVSGNNTAVLGQARYRLNFDPIASLPDERVLCDIGIDEIPVLYSTTYEWVLGDECPATCPCEAPLCFIADYDGSGAVDSDDTIAFYSDWDAGSSAADVNFDGGVDGDDVIAFNCWWDINGGYCFE